MKKFIILLVCLSIVGGGSYFGYTKYKESNDKKVTVDVVPMNLVAEPSEYYEYYSNPEMSGFIVSANAQSVYVDSEKLIKKVYVEAGQSVKKGDTILEYDMTVVELELAQKENQVKVIEQNIKTAQKEIATYKTYKPFEDAPKVEEPEEETPVIDYEESEDPLDSEIYEEDDDSSVVDSEIDPPAIEPVETTKLVTAVIKSENKGTMEDPYIINCNEKTTVTKAFMNKLCFTKKFAQLCVYDEDSQFLYKWNINCENISTKNLAEWVVSNGVTLNKETGLISLDTQAVHFGSFSVNVPTLQEDLEEDDSSLAEDDSEFLYDDSEYEEDYSDEDFSEEDYSDEDYSDYEDDTGYVVDEDSDDYMYTRAEIAEMIREKEEEIKDLELEKKFAELDYNNSKKQTADGKVVAEIDGIVKKIGDAEDSTPISEDEDMEFDEDMDFDEYEGDYQDGEENDAFAVIEGEGGVEVQCEVSELNLSNVPIGSSVSVMSWETGSSCEATITSVDDEPMSYTSYNWGENPNNSTYIVYAKLSDSSGFTVGDWVNVTLVQDESTASNSVYLPIHYVRQEDGNYYIMKADKDNRLTKQYIKIGKILYGYTIEVKGGISMDDKICFPYGTDVKEGTRTKDSTEVLYPEY